jgi:hypothetical protein
MAFDNPVKIMPTVLRVGRFRFFFFSNEGREPPHIHVKAGASEAKFWLQPIALAANYGFNGKTLRRLEELTLRLVFGEME